MSLRVAVQMDPIEHINIKGDSTFALMLEAQRRGHRLYFYTPGQLSLLNGKVVLSAQPVDVRDEVGNHVTLGDKASFVADDFDVILLRQDPPFDMNYITTTHLLERVHPKPFVVNNPFWVRNAPEKILVTEFSDLMAPTLISRDRQAIDAFREQHKDIVMKPLYGNGGSGVFRIKADDTNYRAFLELFLSTPEPWVTQAFLPAVIEGDKRVILIDGAYAGAVNRKPVAGDIRSNMVRGGQAELCSLNEKEMAIVKRLGASLKEKGLIFTGIDLIGETITEINVTSPTGLRAIEREGGGVLAVAIWDTIEGYIIP